MEETRVEPEAVPIEIPKGFIDMTSFERLCHDLETMGIGSYADPKHETVMVHDRISDVVIVFHYDQHTDTVRDFKGESMDRVRFLNMMAVANPY